MSLEESDEKYKESISTFNNITKKYNYFDNHIKVKIEELKRDLMELKNISYNLHADKIIIKDIEIKLNLKSQNIIAMTEILNNWKNNFCNELKEIIDEYTKEKYSQKNNNFVELFNLIEKDYKNKVKEIEKENSLLEKNKKEIGNNKYSPKEIIVYLDNRIKETMLSLYKFINVLNYTINKYFSALDLTINI
jgi:uncharacterized membrane-anchored protein YhcB (DUF1043 family)